MIVAAVGGNALLPPSEPLTHEAQQRAARATARSLAPLAGSGLVVTHGNGPQVGLLALQQEAYRASPRMPLDVLGAESQGMVGYVLEQALDDALGGREVVTVLTRVLVDRDDPAFARPTKPVGPVYSASRARSLAGEFGWEVAGEGDRWRRVVPSPEPREVIPLPSIRRLVAEGVVVVCAGGGGIPVAERGDGSMDGAEAVIDKDLTAALLATSLGAEALLLLTDVEAVVEGWGSPEERPIRHAAPGAMRRLPLAGGSMGPKVEAACRFAEATGRWAGIGRIDRAVELVDGTTGTRVDASGDGLAHW